VIESFTLVGMALLVWTSWSAHRSSAFHVLGRLFARFSLGHHYAFFRLRIRCPTCIYVSRHCLVVLLSGYKDVLALLVGLLEFPPWAFCLSFRYD